MELSADEQCERLYKNRIKTVRIKTPRKSNKNVVKAQSLRNIHAQPFIKSGASLEVLPERIIEESMDARITESAIDSVRISIVKPAVERSRNRGTTIIQDSPTITSNSIAGHKKWKLSKVPLWIIISSLLSMGSFILLRSKFKSLSRWAAAHPKSSQGLIVASQIVTGGTAFLTGGILYDHGFLVSDAVTQTALACAAGAAILYPFNDSPNSYIRRKVHDITLFGTGTILALSVGNNHLIQSRLPVSQQPLAQVQAFTNDKIESTLTTQIIMQGHEKKQRQNIGLKVLLTILTLLALCTLEVLVAALSCELSCSGSGTLAGVVIIGGTCLIIAAAIAVIRKIWGRKRRNRNKVVENIQST